MLADVAEEIEVGDGGSPIGVVEKAGGIGFGLEIEEHFELLFDGGDVGVEDFFGEKLAFLGFAAGIADGTGRAAGERDGMMAHELETAKREERDHAADVEGIGSGVEAGIEDAGGGKFLGERRAVIARTEEKHSPRH